MNRGEVWWANLPQPIASEPGYSRPVLIVQSDAFNRSRIKTIIAVAISSNMRLADAPGNVLLKAQQTGLPTDSVANVSQIITIDKTFLAECCGCIGHATLRAVEDGLRLALSL